MLIYFNRVCRGYVDVWALINDLLHAFQELSAAKLCSGPSTSIGLFESGHSTSCRVLARQANAEGNSTDLPGAAASFSHNAIVNRT